MLVNRLITTGLCLLFLLLLWPGYGQCGILLDPSKDGYNLTSDMKILSDPDGQLTVNDVISPRYSSKFRPVETRAIHLEPGMTLWLRWSLTGPSAGGYQRLPWILEVANANADEVDFYLPDGSGGAYIKKSAGALRELSLRERKHPHFIFYIWPEATVFRTYYLRIKSHAFIAVPVRLWTEKSFLEKTQADTFVNGLIFGVLISMALYNLFLFLSLRERLFALYVGFTLSLTVFLACLNGRMTMLIDSGAGNTFIILWLSLGLTWLFVCGFAKSFLATKRSMPKIHHLWTFCQGLALLLMVFGLLRLNHFANVLAQVLGLLGPVSAFIAGMIRFSQGYRPARYFLLAWTLFLVSVVFFVLSEMSVLPLYAPGSLLMALGSAMEALLLSFALADRIRMLRQEKDALAESRARYREASITDGLTSLFNLRHFNRSLEKEVRYARELDRPLSLLMLDVDDFKHFNDTHGHQQGDEVLRRLAQIMRSCARNSDLAARYGGEEFTLVLPHTDAADAKNVAQRIRSQFEQEIFVVGDNSGVHATVSIGLAQLGTDETAGQLIQRADKALYQAKRQGKNMVCQLSENIGII